MLHHQHSKWINNIDLYNTTDDLGWGFGFFKDILNF